MIIRSAIKREKIAAAKRIINSLTEITLSAAFSSTLFK